MPELILYKNKWLCSYETLLFDTPDGDINIGQYAPDENGTGYYIRTKPKTEAQFDWVDLKYDVSELTEVKILPGHTYYDEFLTATGATNLWTEDSIHTGKDPSQLPSGSVLRIQSNAKKYWDTAQIKDYPQPKRTETIEKLPPEEPKTLSQEPHSIALDATSNSGYRAGASSYSWNHTCTGDNRLLAFGVSHYYATVTGVTYNGVDLTQIRLDEYSHWKTSVHYLIAPDTGENTLAVTFTGNSYYSVGGIVSYTGAKQSDQPDAHNGASVYGASPGTVDVTTIADNCWVFAVSYITAPVTSNNTERWSFLGENDYYHSGSDTDGPKTPAGSQTMSWDFSGGDASTTISAASFAPVEVGGVNYPRSAAVIIGTLSTATRAIAIDRNSSIIIGILLPIAGVLQEYFRQAAVIVGVVVSAARVYGAVKSASVIIGIVASATRIANFPRSALVVVGSLVTASRSIAIIRASSVIVGNLVAASKSWGRAIASSVIVGIVATASRAITVTRTASVVVGNLVSTSKSWGRSIASSVIVGMVSTASRAIAITRASSTIIGNKVTASKSLNRDITSSVIVGVVASANRIYGAVISASVIVGNLVSASVTYWSGIAEYLVEAAVSIGVAVSASRTFARTRTASVIVGIVASSSRAMTFIRSATTIVGNLVTSSRLVTYARYASKKMLRWD